ncbi:WYL domain-containing protein [Paracoccus marcusii]|uniref:WYL domain-containing protein n=1 Tax=Paracoccus marcusii TaxID=59779 RepID=UPI002ED072DD|nr:WYL domain-containing protein [Paracoccus marcusii]
MTYDKSARTYVRGPGFKSVFGKLDAGRYLAQLRSLEDGLLDRDDCWTTDLPAFGSTPTPARGVQPETLRAVVGAIRRTEAIEVNYQSLPPRAALALDCAPCHCLRWVSLACASLLYDGRLLQGLLLSRMLEVRGAAEAVTTATDDADWHSEVTLEVGPHPDLSETQAKVIALDYGMQDGKAEIKVRRALLYYTLKRLGLDTDPSARKPQDQQIVLLNRETSFRRSRQNELERLKCLV